MGGKGGNTIINDWEVNGVNYVLSCACNYSTTLWSFVDKRYEDMRQLL